MFSKRLTSYSIKAIKRHYFDLGISVDYQAARVSTRGFPVSSFILRLTGTYLTSLTLYPYVFVEITFCL